MLDCIKRLIKRGKRKGHQKPKNSPYSLFIPGALKSHNDIMSFYDYETQTKVLKRKHHGIMQTKFPK